ncbi:MAG TPA: dihydroorotase [Candidatus Limnocylindria bacterium]|nr:dihydroorotase [Candidatus Limnocylindria bacterium]
MSRFGSLADAPASLLVRGARVIDPANGTDGVADVAIHAGLIADASSLPADAAEIDASGLLAIPGLCDLHAHLREPGGEAAETVASGARAAARGGYTTICAMPNTDPPLDEPARVAYVKARAADAACRVRVVAAATRGRSGEQMVDVGELAELGIAGVSDDGAAVASARVARGLLAYLAPIGLPLIEHAEEPSLAEGTLMRAGATATRLGLAGWPASAELSMVERDTALAAETGGWLHVTHLSTAVALRAIQRAKAHGVRITCDVTPHHLAMTDAWVAGERRFAWDAADGDIAALDASTAYDGNCRVTPPLGTRSDAQALMAGLADGTIDAIATDHAPHPPERKLVEFSAAAPGMIGLETALSIGLAAVGAGCLTLAALVAAVSTRPARLIGEERSMAVGARADITLVDPAASWTVTPELLASASANTPLLGMSLPGVVRLTVADGRVTYDGELLQPG